MSTSSPSFPDAFELVAGDIYRDIHKAVRATMFETVLRAGRTDPNNREERIALAAAVADLADFLAFHAHHEDSVLEPMIAEVLPDEAEAIRVSHEDFDAEIERIRALAALVFDEDRADARASLHEMYLSLAAFTSRYLAHQHVEERVVMPALLAHYGLAAVIDANERIVTSITPDALAWGLAKMLPVMNADDRFELLTGMHATAPAPAFAAVMQLTEEVLTADDHAELTQRLGLALAAVPA
jgi:hypothetical protein